jgi:peptide/nickel transport system substrate-binding protein
MISRRAVLTASLALGIAVAATPSPFAWAKEARILQITSPREITSLAPADTGYHFRRLRVAETLVTTDPEGKLAPELAESWSVSDDGLTWTFVIRKGVRFHDGSALTPELVRDAVDVMRKSRNNTEMVSQLPISSLNVDGQAVVIALKRPFSLVPAFFTDGAAIILAPSAFAKDGTVTKIIGTGSTPMRSSRSFCRSSPCCRLRPLFPYRSLPRRHDSSPTRLRLRGASTPSMSSLFRLSMVQSSCRARSVDPSWNLRT